jgi:AsmA protein
VKFSDGVATAEDIRIEGPAAKITMTGTASVPTREYDMKGVASLNTTSGFELPFVVQGPWDDPLIFPDSEVLIRRSPFGAQLLKPQKDDKTGDTVRSVIEKITGVKRPPPADSPTAENARENAKDSAKDSAKSN